jgi:hypothetical protein
MKWGERTLLDTLEKIKEEHLQFLIWVKSIEDMPDKKWRAPYATGKWSPSEIVAHLLFWDRFLLSLTIPAVNDGDMLPPFPPVEEENQKAAIYAGSKSKKDLIEEFIQVRNEYTKQLDSLNEEMLSISFKVGEHSFTILSLIEDFQGHDFHHQKQIQAVK